MCWRAGEQSVFVDVQDTGRGIPAEKLALVFEPFMQAGRSAEERNHGVGLGLAISRELARAMSADLSVDSTGQRVDVHSEAATCGTLQLMRVTIEV